MVFTHNLSEYELTDDLPQPIEDPDLLPDNVDGWLQYFPQACPRARRGYTYMSVLLGFREHFLKVVKTTTSWFWKTNLDCGNLHYNKKQWY